MNEMMPPRQGFPNRTPCCEVESELIELQAEIDELGIEAYRQILEAHFATSEQARLKDLNEIAAQKLSEIVDFGNSATLSARYIYDTLHSSGAKPELVYPVDTLHWSAYIEGRVLGVKQLLLEHPAKDRKGLIGYRSCVEIEASRVMGWHGEAGKAVVIYAPIGELYTGEISYNQGITEAVEPDPISSPSYIFFG
ncbi:MAG: hypothetical protein WD467_02270 [Candidatus Saccharimonadales bacterium]